MLVGPDDGSLGDVGDLEIIVANEVIAWTRTPPESVRTKKDSTLVRAAEAVRDGRASAMVAPATPAPTMACRAVADGPAPGVARPAIATPAPDPRRAARRC